MKMDVKVIIVLVCVFVPCWAVTATPVQISPDGPSHLPALWAPRGVMSALSTAENERTVTYRKDAALSSHFNEPEELSLGGRDAEIGEFPFIVSLQVRTWVSHFHTCGGSIITHHTVLTAAHCVKGQTVDTMKVVAGILHLKGTEESEQTRDVTRFVTHRGYDPDSVSANDVALVFVKEPFEFNKFVRSIPIANPKAKESEGFAVVAGWGNTKPWPYSSVPNTMQTEILPLMSHAQCVAQMEKENIPEIHVTKTMLCTGPLQKDYGPCHGDSGGPLVQNGTLLGIVSWNSGRCGSSSVSGFTRVSSFTEWILEVDTHVRHHSSNEDFYDRDIYHD